MNFALFQNFDQVSVVNNLDQLQFLLYYRV